MSHFCTLGDAMRNPNSRRVDCSSHLLIASVRFIRTTEDLGDYDQVGRSLRQLLKKAKSKIGCYLYAKSDYLAPYQIAQYPAEDYVI